ncbi:MAG: hypothetical protein QM778_10345 [Myxococcales bacterium]
MGTRPLAAWLSCLAVILPLLCAEQPAQADEGAERAPGSPECPEVCEAARVAPARMLNGHRFIPFQVVTWPLVTTRFAAVTSAGALWVQRDAGNSETLVTLQENFLFEWALLRWLGIEGNLLGSTASATDLDGILGTGASYAYGGRIGLVTRLLERGAFYFSARVDGEEQRFQTIVPRRALQDVRISLTRLPFHTSRIVDSGRLYRVRPSLNLAVGVARWFGLQTSLALSVDTQTRERTGAQTYTTLDVALGGSFDLNQVRVPVSILVGGRLMHDLSQTPPFVAALQPSGTSRGQLELALYYSGRPGFDLGLSVRCDLGSSESALLFSPVINYVW